MMFSELYPGGDDCESKIYNSNFAHENVLCTLKNQRF